MNRLESGPPTSSVRPPPRALRWFAALCVASLCVACSSGDDDDDAAGDVDAGSAGIDAGGAGGFSSIPLIAPPVMAATPAGFHSMSLRLRGGGPPNGFTAQAFRDRFFSGGPTDLQQLLTSVDDRIAEVNGFAMATPRACTDLEPVEYSLTPWGAIEPFYAQCYRMTGTPTALDPAFMQFGRKDGADYLYVAGGAARLAARVQPIEGTDGFDVMLWFGVGYDNAETCGEPPAFDGCSYGVAQLHADSSAAQLEMVVGGIGVGFCGAQISSDGAAIYGQGSADMGETCNDRAEVCVEAADLETVATCEPPPAFALRPIGRLAATGSHESGLSDYPDLPSIVLDGTVTDSLHFGPEAPTEGVGDFEIVAP